jgi:hypothetical protein
MQVLLEILEAAGVTSLRRSACRVLPLYIAKNGECGHSKSGDGYATTTSISS